MTVLNAEPNGYSLKAVESWKKKGYHYRDSSWEEIDRTRSFENVHILIVRLAKKIDNSILNKFPNLIHLISATTGLDHIDMEAVKGKGIKLVSLRGQDDFLQTIPSTAEFTWALLLALIRNVPAANEHVKQGFWDRDQFRGYQLKGKTIGIIGLGRTGRKVAGYAKAFEMQVQYFDPFVTEISYQKCDDLETLLQTSDIISLHVHLNEETFQLIGTHNISHLKEGCLLINTSRGNILDENAVVLAITNNRIRGIASDVLCAELENIKLSPLWLAQQKNKNIIITPHIGGASKDAMWACEEFIVDLV